MATAMLIARPPILIKAEALFLPRYSPGNFEIAFEHVRDFVLMEMCHSSFASAGQLWHTCLFGSQGGVSQPAPMKSGFVCDAQVTVARLFLFCS